MMNSYFFLGVTYFFLILSTNLFILNRSVDFFVDCFLWKIFVNKSLDFSGLVDIFLTFNFLLKIC